jgi:hypothetical protein
MKRSGSEKRSATAAAPAIRGSAWRRAPAIDAQL